MTSLAQSLDARGWTSRAGLAAAVAVALGPTGCGGGGGGGGGGGEDFPQREGPPAPIIVSTAITPAGISVSPSRLGAGAVQLIASNLTSISQSITLRSERMPGDGERLEQGTGPISPGDTASLTADLAEGTYRVSARSAAIEPATIEVRAPRESARGRLLQP